MGSGDKIGTSNHLESHSGTTDRTGGNRNRHSDSHPRDINGSWQHLEIIPELFGGSGTSMHSERHPQITNGSGSIDLFDIKPKVVEGNRSTNPFETIPELPDGNERVSSSEDLFQVGTELGNFGSQTQPSKDEEINVSNSNSSKSRVFDNSPVPASTARLSQFTDELMVHDMPPTQSPPIQVMDRSREYDPLRIPSAIFERSKSSTPQEWSAASNESLFSIHIGNNSFSRDQFKSGELIKTDDMSMFNPSPTIPEVRADGEGSIFEKSDANGGSVKNTKEGTTVDKSQEKAPPANVLRNSSDMSDHSNDSACSFAFPILTDRVTSASVKPDVEEKKQNKPLATEVVTPKSSSSCCWSSCSSCRPCSCSFPTFHCSSCCCCYCCCRR